MIRRIGSTVTSRWQTITLATLFVGYSGYYVCRSNFSVATTMIIDDPAESITLSQMGMIASTGTFLYSIGKASNGILCDFLGGRTLFLLGMIASILCTIAFGLGSGLILFSAAWAVNRYVGSMGWGGLMKVASRWFPVSYHATAMGWLSLSYLLGDALVRLYLGTFIRYGVGWRGIFFISAATLAVIALATFFLLKSSPLEVGADEPPADPANLFGSSGESPHPESLGQLLWPLLGSLSFWLICVMSVGLTLIRETVTLWLPKILKDELQFKEGEAAQWSMLFPLAGAAAALLAGFLSDRLKGRHSLVAMPALVLLAVSLILLGVLPLAGEVTLTLILIGAVAFFLMAPYSFCAGVIALNLGGKRGSSTAAGLIDAAGYLGAVFSGYGISELAQLFGWPTVFLVLAGAAVLTALVTVLYWLRQPQRTETLNLEAARV